MFLCGAVFDIRLSLTTADLDVWAIVYITSVMLLITILEFTILTTIVNDFDVTVISICFNDTVMVWVG